VAAYVRAILLTRDEGLFLNVAPRRRKKRLIIEVSALTLRSEKRRIAKRLKRDVRPLGLRLLQKIMMRHQLDARWPPCPTGSREPWRSTRSSHLIVTDSLIS
jgi:hypothetical protein